MMKKITVALVAAGGLLVAAAPAHAGGHVSLSLGIGLPGIGVGYAAPAYYGPPPAVYAPAPAYAPQYVPAYAPVYAPAPYYDGAPYYGARYYGPRYYGPRYYGPRYYGPAVDYRAGPLYRGYR